MANTVIPEDAEHPNVLHALTRKRAEIAGQIEHNQIELRRLVAALDHLDASIRLFDPTLPIERIVSKPHPPRHAAFKGEVTRIVFDALRTAKGPVTSLDIAARLMKERGLSPDDRDPYRTMVKRVGACLRLHQRKGLVRVVESMGAVKGWAVAG